MKHNWKRMIACLLTLALVTTLSLGCGGDEDKQRVVIRIGEITDFTGPGSPAVRTIHYVLEDAARYYNEEGLIPGVKMEIISYDTKMDQSREVPGYDWVRDRGAQVVMAVYQLTGDILKPFAERDRIVVTNLTASVSQIEPPGWVFCFSSPTSLGFTVLMQWISEEHWDWETDGPAKIGFAGWADPNSVEVKEAIEGYCQDYPERFEWVGGFLSPLGTMVFSNEAEKLKHCDYVSSFALVHGYFLKEFRARGYTATMIDSNSSPAYLGFLVDKVGWEGLDGMLASNVTPWWDEEGFPIVDLAKELLSRYRAGEAEDIMKEGSGYVGALHQILGVFDVLRATVEEVGAENFDNEAFYNAAIKYQASGAMFEGYPQWGFSETKRNFMDHYLVYEFDADVENLVRRSDWLHVLE